MHARLAARLLGRQIAVQVRAVAQQPHPPAVMAFREAKQQARKDIKSALKTLTGDEMARESASIAEHVLAMLPYQTAKTVGLYLHCHKLKEVDTGAILKHAMQHGKRVYVPVVEDSQSNMKFVHLDDLASLRHVPPFDILEPTEAYTDGSPREDALQSHACLELLLVPGLGFDRTGRRLGRGGGYYDKFIAALQSLAAEKGREPPLLVALSYEVQLLEAIPTDSHDQAVDLLVTHSHVYGCTERGRAVLQRT